MKMNMDALKTLELKLTEYSKEKGLIPVAADEIVAFRVV